MSVQVAAADTAAEVAAEAAAANPANRPPKKTSQTCSTCRLRKVRCDGRRDICQNCERLGFTCSFQETGSPHPDSDGLTPFSLPRRRVRLACTNCHSRKARCTGETPKCARCQSQGIECVYRPTKRSAGVNGTAGGTNHGTPDSEHESVASEPPEKRSMTHKEHHGSHHGHGRDSSLDQSLVEISASHMSKRLGQDSYVYRYYCSRNTQGLILAVSDSDSPAKTSSNERSTTTSATSIMSRCSPFFTVLRLCNDTMPA